MELDRVKLYIGPMSKNIVDAVIDFSNENGVALGFIPSRRQIDFKSGYVNNWTTKAWVEYVRLKGNLVILERDHGGPEQGDSFDDGLASFSTDSKWLDIIHIDVWKRFKDIEVGAQKTIDYMRYCNSINENILFEVGTEEAIRPMEVDDLFELLTYIQKKAPQNIYSKIAYVVIQSGTKLLQNTNIGSYDRSKLDNMLLIASFFGLLTKEHNGDYIGTDSIKDRFAGGLSAINIAPEFGMMESEILLELLNENEINILFNACLESGRWKKWVSNDYQPLENTGDFIKICGHYVLSNPQILEITNKYKEIPALVKSKVYEKIQSILS